MMGVIFITGCYGVGKSTIMHNLSSRTSIPCFSASRLISEATGEKYGKNKYVSDKNSNQIRLVSAIEKKLKKYPQIFLDGHFCIFKEGNAIDILPLTDLAQMHFEKILLLEAEPNIILKNLSNRDGKEYTLENITNLMDIEHQQAVKFSNENKIPLYVYQMQLDGFDLDKILAFCGEI